MSLVQRLCSVIEDYDQIDIDILTSLVAECKTPSELDGTFEGMTPLGLACQLESLDVIQILLKAGCSVNLRCGYFNKAPLHYTVNREVDDPHNAEIIELLVNFGADVNLQDSDGNTPLHIACTQENEHCVNSLLKNGAKLNQMDVKEETPLIRACLAKNDYIIARLVTAGCDVNEGEGRALRILVQSENSMIKSIKLLFRHGADIRLQNYLCAACTQNHIEVVKYLHEKGADVNMEGNIMNNGINALHQACINKNVGHKIVELLLEWGAMVNAITHARETALHYASQSISFNKVAALLNYGARVNCIDTAKFTPFGALLTTRLANDSFNDYMKLARLLKAAGAKLSEEELTQIERTIPVALSPAQTEEDIAKFLSMLKYQSKQPKKLINISCLKIRACLSAKIDQNVELLMIPEYLKGLLLFSEVISR